MKKTNTNAIVFAQAKDSKKAVVSNKYVAYAIYAQNKALVEALGGEIIKGVDGFRAEFKSEKNAKAFIAQAVTHISEKDYNKARKTEPKAKVEKKASVPAPTKAKGKAEVETVTVNGKLYAMTETSDGFVLTLVKKSAKAKGNAKPTTAPNAKVSKSAKAKAEPRKTKGNCKVDFSKLAGKGTSANKQAAALMRKAGLVDGTSAEYKAVWAEWCKVR